MKDPKGFLFVGLPCILIIIAFVTYLLKSDHPFQSKKSYEKEIEDARKSREEMNKKYPTIVSRLSLFFCMPEDQIKEELRKICNERDDH